VRRSRSSGAPPGLAALAALAALAWPGPAWAHSLSTRFGDFYGGILHPATALEQALPLIALGLLAGQNGPRPARWLLPVVPVAFALGSSLGGVLPAPPYLWVINTGSFLLLGLLLAFDGALPLPLLLGLGAGLGLSHGLANGSGMAGATDPWLFVLGGTLAALAAILLPSALVVSLEAAWQRIAVRIAGSWIAAVGAMILALPQAGTPD
jgi:urease accessory protein